MNMTGGFIAPRLESCFLERILFWFLFCHCMSVFNHGLKSYVSFSAQNARETWALAFLLSTSGSLHFGGWCRMGCLDSMRLMMETSTISRHIISVYWKGWQEKISQEWPPHCLIFIWKKGKYCQCWNWLVYVLGSVNRESLVQASDLQYLSEALLNSSKFNLLTSTMGTMVTTLHQVVACNTPP